MLDCDSKWWHTLIRISRWASDTAWMLPIGMLVNADESKVLYVGSIFIQICHRICLKNQPQIFAVVSKSDAYCPLWQKQDMERYDHRLSFILKLCGCKPTLCFIIAKCVCAHARKTKYTTPSFSHSHEGQREDERWKEEAHANTPTYHECTLHTYS